MTETRQQDPFEAIGSDSITALNRFDNMRIGLYDLLGDIAAATPDLSVYHDDVSTNITETAAAFGSLALALKNSDGDFEANKDMIVGLWEKDGSERVKLFLEFFGETHTQCFEELGVENAMETVDEIYRLSENDEELQENVELIFREGLAGDVEEFAGHVQANREERLEYGEIQEETGDVEIIIDLKSAARLVRDIAKIAVGVSLGIAISRRFSK